jgi:NAD(P)-dependent dehydrogenase (short-subunit alcohol dehydrogenase family)
VATAPRPILDGRVAIVTGAGQGVGLGVAHALAAEGARVVCAGRTEAKVAAAAAAIAERGGEATAVRCDVGVADDVEACVATTVDRYGTVDVLVNNAQTAPLGPLLGVTDEQYDVGFRSGPFATLRFMRACHPHLAGGGCIVNMGSGVATRPDLSGFGAYSSVKEAIRVLTRAAACEWGADGIRVNAVLPLALSPAMDAFVTHQPEEAQAFLSAIPLGRFGDCERDVGRAVVFLCGPDASYITGATLTVDGGQDHIR